jgi:hypothetical protein
MNTKDKLDREYREVRELFLQPDVSNVLLDPQELKPLARFCEWMDEQADPEIPAPVGSYIDLRHDEYGQLTFLLHTTAREIPSDKLVDCEIGPFWVEAGFDKWVEQWETESIYTWGG